MDQSMNREPRSSDRKSKSSDVKSSATEGIRDAKNRVSEAVNKMDVQIPPEIEERLQALREQSQIAFDRTEDLVRRHPFYSVACAAAVGAVVASIFNMRMRRSLDYSADHSAKV